MNQIVSSVLRYLRMVVGVSEVFLFLGMALLYSGLSVLVSHALAQTVCGFILISMSAAIAWKGS